MTGMCCEGQCNKTAPWGWSDGTVPVGQTVMDCPVGQTCDGLSCQGMMGLCCGRQWLGLDLILIS